MSETVKCPACGHKELEEKYEKLLYCPACGHAIAKKLPTDKELQKLYSQEYFFGKEYFDYIADRAALERNFKARLKRLKHTYHKDAHIIEIGCAYGYFLDLIKDGVAIHRGYDINEEGIVYAKEVLGVNAHNVNFLEAEIQQNSVDSVYMWDVIEHLPRPALYLKESCRILKRGGYLALTTGDIGAFIPKLRKDKWRMIHPPTHLHYFTQDSIKEMLEHNGLKVVSIKHKGIHRNLGSVMHQISYNRKAQDKSSYLLETLTLIAENSKLSTINIPLNTGDIMEVVAVKN